MVSSLMAAGFGLGPTVLFLVAVIGLVMSFVATRILGSQSSAGSQSLSHREKLARQPWDG